MLSEVPMVLLDEPTSNLDRRGIEWYQNLIDQFGQNRILIVAQMNLENIEFCNKNRF